MNNPYFNQRREVEARQQTLMHQAEKARIVNAYIAQKRTPFYAPLLAQTGKVMLNIGNRLVVRYGRAIDEITAAHTQADPNEATA